jgi:hypothetical protein
MRVPPLSEPLDEARAIGRLSPNGPWVGFAAHAGGYRLVVGLGDRRRSADAEVDLLLAVGIAYFTEALDDPPPELEATQADLSTLVARLADAEADVKRRGLLREALDAIDDGLAGDAVAGRLGAARSPRNQQLDPIELLRMRSAQIVEES